MDQLPLFDLPPRLPHARRPVAPRPAPAPGPETVAIWDAIDPRILLRQEGRGRPTCRPAGLPPALWELWSKHVRRTGGELGDPAALAAFVRDSLERSRTLRARHGWDLERIQPPAPRPEWTLVVPARLMPEHARKAWRARIAQGTEDGRRHKLTRAGLYRLTPQPKPKKTLHADHSAP